MIKKLFAYIFFIFFLVLAVFYFVVKPNFINDQYHPNMISDSTLVYTDERIVGNSDYVGDVLNKSERNRIEKSSHHANTNLMSIDDKIDNEELMGRKKVLSDNDGKEVIFSDAFLLDRLLAAGVDVPEDLAERMKTGRLTKEDENDISILVFSIRTEEEAMFDNATDFSDLRMEAKKMEEATGEFYGSRMLEHSLAYKNATYDDLAEIFEEGGELPDNALTLMVYQDNLELAKELKEVGYSIGENHVNPYNGMTAIEEYANGLAIFPGGDGLDGSVRRLSDLIALGVPRQLDDGTRDAIDILLQGAVHQSREDAEILLRSSQFLLKNGFDITRSHIELMEKVRVAHNLVTVEN